MQNALDPEIRKFLEALYRQTGRTAEADAAAEQVRELTAREGAERVDFLEAVRGGASDTP